MTNVLLRSGLFGSLLQDKEIAALFSADAMLMRMVAFERAWTVALRDTGLASQSAARAALAALDETKLDLSAIAEAADRDGVPVPALVSALRARAGPDGATAIHTGATSQDVVDTAMVLALSDALDLLCARLEHVNLALATMSERFGAQPMMARTRMQAARPIVLADRIASWSRPLMDAGAAVPQLRERLCRVQYGGAVGTRDGVEGRGDAIASLLGRALGLASDGPCWHSNRGAIADAGHWLVTLCGACGKLGQDIALMAQQGVDEVRLRGAGTSSAMAHKQNPVRAEILVALARFTAAQQGLLGQALVHEQERSGSAWALEWLTLPPMMEATGAALRQTSLLVEQVQGMGTAATTPD